MLAASKSARSFSRAIEARGHLVGARFERAVERVLDAGPLAGKSALRRSRRPARTVADAIAFLTSPTPSRANRPWRTDAAGGDHFFVQAMAVLAGDDEPGVRDRHGLLQR